VAAEVPDAKPTVLVSILPQKYFVNRLAGESVQAEVMIPPGVSVEHFEPTMKQMQLAARAKLYFTIGHSRFPFEKTWLAKFGESKQLSLINCSLGLDLLEDDPHIWVAPREVRQIVMTISKALEELLPEQQSKIAERRLVLLQEIDALHVRLEKQLNPLREHVFIIYHPELGYFAREFGLVQRSIEQEGKDVGAHELAKLIEEAKSLGISQILAQPQANLNSARTVAQAIDGVVVLIDPLAYDWLKNTEQIGNILANVLAYHGHPTSN